MGVTGMHVGMHRFASFYSGVCSVCLLLRPFALLSLFGTYALQVSCSASIAGGCETTSQNESPASYVMMHREKRTVHSVMNNTSNQAGTVDSTSKRIQYPHAKR